MKSCVACVAAAMAFLCLSETVRCGEEKPTQRIRDMVYGRRDGLALTMDIFLPPGKANGVALIHIVSGNFRSSPEAIMPAFNMEFLNRGYTIFAVVPGSVPRYTVPEMHEDVCRAVRHVRHHAKKYNIDPKRIGGGGASSGGLLGLLLATSPRPADSMATDLVDREDSSIQASANFFPPTDFLNYGAEGKKRSCLPLPTQIHVGTATTSTRPAARVAWTSRQRKSTRSIPARSVVRVSHLS